MKILHFGLLVGFLFPAVTMPAEIPVLETVQIKEWLVPWENTRPRDPYVDKKGRVWFCGQTGDYIAYFNPGTEKFKRYDLDPGTGPHNLIVDKKGYIWFAGNQQGYIGRLSPKSGKIKKFPMPDPDIKDPHTLEFDGKGDIWFTALASNVIGKLVVETGEIKLIPLQTSGARPYGIKVDSWGRPWVALFGTNRLALVNPETYAAREYTLPRGDIRPRRLAITSFNKIWLVDYAGGYLGRFDPNTRAYREHRVPGGAEAGPYAIAVDDKDRLWFVETGVQPNRLVSYDPKLREFTTMTDIPSGGGSVRHMYFHPQTREMWFGTDTNFIGRVTIP